MRAMKFCKDCRFIGKPDVIENAPRPPDLEVCLHPKARLGGVDAVTGKDHGRPGLARFQRQRDWVEARMLGYCGKGGRWWKPKVEGQ